MSAAPHVCVAALLVRDACVLLGRRAEDREWLPGAWDLPGGHVEPGETPDAALTREVLEETGIVPESFRCLDVLDGRSGDRDWRLHVFVVDRWKGEPVNRRPDEHAELRWCDRAEAQRLLAGAHPRFATLLECVLQAAAR